MLTNWRISIFDSRILGTFFEAVPRTASMVWNGNKRGQTVMKSLEKINDIAIYSEVWDQRVAGGSNYVIAQLARDCRYRSNTGGGSMERQMLNILVAFGIPAVILAVIYVAKSRADKAQG